VVDGSLEYKGSTPRAAILDEAVALRISTAKAMSSSKKMAMGLRDITKQNEVCDAN
jgi:hypothetical protein